MIMKRDCRNIIKIKGYSIKANKLKQVTRLFILIEKFVSSLDEPMQKSYIISDEQKLEIAIEIAEGLISLHSGNTTDNMGLNHNDI